MSILADQPTIQILEDKPSPCLFFRSTSHSQPTVGIRNTKLCVVDSQDGITEMIETIVSQAKPVLYITVEGPLLVLHVHPEPNCSFIVDLQELGSAAFGHGNAAQKMAVDKIESEQKTDEGDGLTHDGPWQQGQPLPSLKAILESKSPSMSKVLFNSRPVRKILAGRFGVKLGSAVDIRRLELECRTAAPWQQQQQQMPGIQAGSVGVRSLRHCLE